MYKIEADIETNDLIMKKAVFDDWKSLYRNITSRPESAKYMLWKIDNSEEESKDRMLRTLEFRKREKYPLTVFQKKKNGIGLPCIINKI